MHLTLAPDGLALARRNTTQVRGGPTRGQMKKGKGKGKGKKKLDDSTEVKPMHIAWRVEWRFGLSGTLITDAALPEYEVLGPHITRMLDGVYRHKLLPFVERGIQQLSVFLEQPRRVAVRPDTEEPGYDDDEEMDVDMDIAAKPIELPSSLPPFVQLDLTRTLRENLCDRAIIEFPTIHVVLPEECAHFPTRIADDMAESSEYEYETESDV